MYETLDLKVSMVETYPQDLFSSLGLEEEKYSYVSDLLEKRGYKVLFECRTGVLTPTQRRLYERFLERVPPGLTVFLEPLIVSFAIRDACDLSGVEYVWLELDGENQIGNCVWLKNEDNNKILDLSNRLLTWHLPKYLIDAYDRHTREEAIKVWEAKVKLAECRICGTPLLSRGLFLVRGQKLRGWKCSTCGHNIVLPSDVLEILQNETTHLEED